MWKKCFQCFQSIRMKYEAQWDSFRLITATTSAVQNQRHEWNVVVKKIWIQPMWDSKFALGLINWRTLEKRFVIYQRHPIFLWCSAWFWLYYILYTIHDHLTVMCIYMKRRVGFNWAHAMQNETTVIAVIADMVVYLCACVGVCVCIHEFTVRNCCFYECMV